MKSGYKIMRAAIYEQPLLLLSMPKSLQKIASSYMPKEVGIEIECSMRDDIHYNMHNRLFSAIPDIIEVNNDTDEQRFRIPSGIKGMICLYKLCNMLKEYSLLNTSSGIHYHIDCREKASFFKFTRENISVSRQRVAFNKYVSMLNWNYDGEYNWNDLNKEFLNYNRKKLTK